MTQGSTRGVIGATLDLMSFLGSGNYTQFSRFFERASGFFGLSSGPEEHRKRRAYAFHHLRASGYIDAVDSKSQTIWSVSNPVLVEVSPDVYKAVCDLTSLRRLMRLVGESQVLLAAPESIRTPAGHIPFYPAMAEIRAGREAVRELAESAGFGLSLDFQRQLYKHLPLIGTVMESTLAPVGEGALFEPGDARRFDFESLEWKNYDGLKPDRPGLYRGDHRFGPSQNFVSENASKDRLAVFRVIQRRWSIVTGLACVNRQLTLKHDKETGELWVPRSELGYPTLLERAFRSGSLSNPRNAEKGWQVFPNIDVESVAQLTTKLPVFRVEKI